MLFILLKINKVSFSKDKMEKVLVYIDSGFTSKVSLNFGGGIPIRYDILKFAKKLVGKEEMVFKHLFFYTAPPYQSTHPSKDEKRRKVKYDSFIDKLKKDQEISVREGRCQKVKEDGKWLYKQKGVDTLLTMDLMDIPLSYPKIKKIILIASDSDFVPIIEKLESLGIETVLYTYFDKKRRSRFSTSNELLKAVKRYKQLKESDFKDAK